MSEFKKTMDENKAIHDAVVNLMHELEKMDLSLARIDVKTFPRMWYQGKLWGSVELYADCS